MRDYLQSVVSSKLALTVLIGGITAAGVLYHTHGTAGSLGALLVMVVAFPSAEAREMTAAEYFGYVLDAPILMLLMVGSVVLMGVMYYQHGVAGALGVLLGAMLMYGPSRIKEIIDEENRDKQSSTESS